MKKVLVMLAAVLALGLFASCENGAKDVNIVDDNSWGKGYEATISGTYTTYTSTPNTTTGKYDFTEHKHDISGYGGTYWDDYKSTNYKLYRIWASMNYKAVSTDTSYTQIWLKGNIVGTDDGNEDIRISKVKDKYYVSRTDINTNAAGVIEVTVTGNITDKEFTVTIPGDKNVNNGNSYSALSLKFTRK